MLYQSDVIARPASLCFDVHGHFRISPGASCVVFCDATRGAIAATHRELIRQGYYFSRDPLAAAVLANPAVVTFHPLAIEISDKPGELGRTVEIKNRRANDQVAIDADDLRFRDVFMTALGVK